MYRSSAVSEVIGSILLISLVVLAVAVIGAGFLSQPPPVQTQDLNVIASNTTTTLYIYHDGGDPMVPGEFALLLDGNPVDPIPAPSGGWPWEIGEVLEIPITTTPQRIQIISLRGGQQNLIREISIGQVTGGGVPITPGTPPTPGPGGQCTQEELENYLNITYISKFSEELNNDAIYLTRYRLGNSASLSGWINMTINSTGSYIVTPAQGNNPPVITNLNINDKLAIQYVDAKQVSANIFSVGGKGWAFAGDNTNIYINPGQTGQQSFTNTNLIDSWILSFKEYDSTLTFQVGGTPQNIFTRLFIKNQTNPEVEGADTNRWKFYNIEPAEPSLLILNFAKKQNDGYLQFVGNVSKIERNDILYWSPS